MTNGRDSVLDTTKLQLLCQWIHHIRPSIQLTLSLYVLIMGQPLNPNTDKKTKNQVPRKSVKMLEIIANLHQSFRSHREGSLMS